MKQAILTTIVLLATITLGEVCGASVQHYVHQLYENPAIRLLIIGYYIYWLVKLLTSRNH